MDNSTQRKKFWRREIKHYIVQAFGNKCCYCGQTFEECCYDLHHLNPEEKEFNLSSGNYNGAKTWLKIRDEVKKCVLLCANCHRKVHNGYIEITNPIFFDENYYDWDITNYKQVGYDLKSMDKIIDPQDFICPICGGEKTEKAKACANCSSHKEKYEIDREELKQLIYTLPFTEIGKKFGVSDNAIRKRCIKYNLPSKKSEIKKYTQEEWNKI